MRNEDFAEDISVLLHKKFCFAFRQSRRLGSYSQITVGIQFIKICNGSNSCQREYKGSRMDAFVRQTRMVFSTQTPYFSLPYKGQFMRHVLSGRNSTVVFSASASFL